MRFAESFVFDDTNTNGTRIKKMLEENKKVPGIFCVCLSASSSNIFEIVSGSQIITAPFKDGDYLVIAFANGRPQAFEIVRKIFKDCLDGGGDVFSVKKELLRKYQVITKLPEV